MQRNHWTTLVALAAAVALASLGGCGSSSSNPAPVLDGIVDGTAMDGAAPVPNAMVKLMRTSGSGGPYMTTTDVDGSYEIDVPPGNYELLAYRDVDFKDFMAPVAVTSSATTTQDIAFLVAPRYMGDSVCLSCHGDGGAQANDEVDAYQRCGHPFKLNKVMGAAPIYPWSSLDTVETKIMDDGLEIPADPPDRPNPILDPNGTETDNALGTPAGWGDITYVIGGFGWKARFIDADGYIVTGTSVQYNFFNQQDGEWHFQDGAGQISAYHNNEQGKKFNCGNCHTTGWRHYDAMDNPARQDNLPGMDGTFAFPGIRCEACHGAGSEHVASPPGNITPEASPRTLAELQHHSAGYGLAIACGECHTRDGERDYPSYVSAAQNAGWAGDANWSGDIGGRIAASGGYVRHHEQYDEIVGIDPGTMMSVRTAAFAAAHGDCGNCHEYHATTRFQEESGEDPFNDPPGIWQDCTDCHDEAKFTPAGTMHLDDPGDPDRPRHCIDCHMPLFSKSALATVDPVAGPPSQGGHPGDGDVRSHIFTIDLSKTVQFTDGTGGFSNPWLTGFYSCNRCHYDGGPAFAMDNPAGTIHRDPP